MNITKSYILFIFILFVGNSFSQNIISTSTGMLIGKIKGSKFYNRNNSVAGTIRSGTCYSLEEDPNTYKIIWIRRENRIYDKNFNLIGVINKVNYSNSKDNFNKIDNQEELIDSSFNLAKSKIKNEENSYDKREPKSTITSTKIGEIPIPLENKLLDDKNYKGKEYVEISKNDSSIDDSSMNPKIKNQPNPIGSNYELKANSIEPEQKSTTQNTSNPEQNQASEREVQINDSKSANQNIKEDPKESDFRPSYDNLPSTSKFYLLDKNGNPPPKGVMMSDELFELNNKK